MAPSPRKSTRSTFNSTWHETDAAFLDPTSLPLPKAPRAWERKTQVTVSCDGKQKKVFRRYTTRSRAANTPDVEEDDEEEHDSRSRAVKKLQRMSPDAMEKNATTKGKRRAFKATRWDRRKSVLPRKKTAPIDETLIDMDESMTIDEITTEAADANNDSASESNMGGQEEAVSSLVPQLKDEAEKRATTFGFVLDRQYKDLTNQENEDLPEPCDDSEAAPFEPGVDQDNTAQFTFRSPVKAAPAYEPNQFAERTATSPIVEQDSTMQFLFRSPSKRASPIKHLQFSKPTGASLGAEEDGTMQMLFHSPSKRTSPFKRSQFDRESTPPLAVEDNATSLKMPRSPVETATPARHVQLVEEMSPTPVKNTTSARHSRFAEATSPPPSIEHDGTIQLLFRSPSKDTLPGIHLDPSEEAKTSPLSEVQSADTLDSEMSNSVEEENTASLFENATVSADFMVVREEKANKERPLQESEGAPEELTASEQIEPKPNVEDPTVGTIDVPLEEERYVGVPADIFTEFEEDEDTEMSEITFSLGLRLSPKKSNAVDEDEVKATDELCEQENTITEASLQLDLQQDIHMTEEEEEDIRVSVEEEELEASVLPEDLGAPSVKDNVGEHDTIPRRAVTTFDQEADTQELELLSEPVVDNMMIDIADGLTLDLATPSSATPKPRRLRSLSPPLQEETGPDDYTMTIALDDDTAILKDFLTRAAANKANKAETIARRTSLINRRDSGAVRHALASPRKILEDKDPNSPSKYDNDVTLDLTQTLTLNADSELLLSPNSDIADAESLEDLTSSKNSRRSTRTRKSRLPAPASVSVPQPPQGPKSIAVRRADGTEPIVLKRTEAQELGLLTRSNTRKNKQGAFVVSVKLFSLNTEAAKNKTEATSDQVANDDAEILAINPITGKKNVRWDQTLAYFQEGTDTQANMKADAESLATPDELSMPLSTPSSKSKIKSVKEKTSNTTPKNRRVKGLGASNGTPGKGLLGTVSLLPDSVVDEKEAPAPAKEIQRIPKPKTSRVKKMPVAPSLADGKVSEPLTQTPLPTLNPAPTAPESAEEFTRIPKERKSRLAMPKKVTLPQPVCTASLTVEGKENQQARSLTAATPKKGIPVPQVIVPSAPVVETGLPRRRGRKM